MRIQFRHPAIAGGHVNGAERTICGMVDTEVEIREFTSGDLQTAFFIRTASPLEISLHDGVLWQPADYELSDVLALGFEGMYYMMGDESCAFRPLAGTVGSQLRRMIRAGGMPALHPRPRSPKVLDPALAKNDIIARYMKSAGRLHVGADQEDVERWRELARRFFSNLILVDGVTYRRTTAPSYIAGFGDLGIGRMSVYSRYLDHPLPSRLGGMVPGPLWRADDSVRYRPDRFEEAFEASRRMRERGGAGNVFHGAGTIDCLAPYDTAGLDELEVGRMAKVHIIESIQEEQQFHLVHGKEATARALAADTPLARYRAAADNAKRALDRVELGGEDFSELERAFRGLLEETRENAQSRHWKTAARRTNLVAAGEIALERVEARPINLFVDAPIPVTRPSART